MGDAHFKFSDVRDRYYLLNTTPVQLDSDGDGQLSLEEFKVLFENAEKRKKDTKHSVRKVCVIDIHQLSVIINFVTKMRMLKD